METLRVEVVEEDLLRGAMKIQLAEEVPYGRSQVWATPLDSEGRAVARPLVSSFMAKPGPGQQALVVGTLLVLSVLLTGAVLGVYRFSFLPPTTPHTSTGGGDLLLKQQLWNPENWCLKAGWRLSNCWWSPLWTTLSMWRLSNYSAGRCSTADCSPTLCNVKY